MSGIITGSTKDYLVLKAIQTGKVKVIKSTESVHTVAGPGVK